MATIKFQQDFKTVTELRDWLNTLPDPHLLKMPDGDVFETKILEDGAGNRWVHIWVMFRGQCFDLTTNREGRPDWDSDHDIDQHPTSF